MTKNKKCTCGNSDDIKMSVPEGMEFNTTYPLHEFAHSEYYYDYDRNGKETKYL